MTDPRELAQRIKSLLAGWDVPSSFPEELEELLAAEMPRWVPCEERMPDLGKLVILVRASGEVAGSFAFWTGNEWGWNDDYDSRAPRESFTHWQPLPSPPREEAK